MKTVLIFAICILFALSVAIPGAPAAAQNYTATGSCGLGQYWLIHDNQWDGVLIRQGDSTTFDGFGAMWMQPDGTATFNINMEGDAVTMDRVDDPNIFGTTSCSYQGTVRPDGVSVVGTTNCQVQGVTSLALSWTAIIVCDVPEITWNDTAFWHRAAKGQQFTFECPFDGFRAPVWGTDIYIEGSSICAAGVHAGAITLENGGLVTIEILPGEPSYPGSTRNGITSDTFPTAGQFNASFRVLGGQDAGSSATTTPPGLISGDPRTIGTWTADIGTLEIYGDGTARCIDCDPPTTFYFTGEDGQTINGYWTMETTEWTCGTEQNGTTAWGYFEMTFDSQYATFEGTSDYCDFATGAFWSGHRGDGQQQGTVVPTPKPTKTPVGTAAPRWDNFMGQWNSSYGVVEIDSNGVATYPGPDSVIPSHIYFQQDDDHTISGYWVQPGSSVNCGVERYGSNYWGRIRWTFDENFATFTGVWAYCEDEPSAYWGGARP